MLADLDARAKDKLGAIPEANRTVISFHDAFPYFAEAYGLTIDGTVVDAPGQDPSAGDVSALIKAIKDKGIKAIFAEAQFNDDLVRTIADESGAVVVSDLYTDSVGDAPGRHLRRDDGVEHRAGRVGALGQLRERQVRATLAPRPGHSQSNQVA